MSRTQVMVALAGLVWWGMGAQTGIQADEADKPKFATPEDLDKLPVGLKVVHEPKEALATLTGKSTRRAKYTWWYKTTVSAKDSEVRIVEFGALVWRGDRWGAVKFPAKPFTAEQFAEWFKCPKAILKVGKTYSDPLNWTSDETLKEGKTRWYFIGIDAKGRRVKGEAVIELRPNLDPKRPKDRE